MAAAGEFQDESGLQGWPGLAGLGEDAHLVWDSVVCKRLAT